MTQRDPTFMLPRCRIVLEDCQVQASCTVPMEVRVGLSSDGGGGGSRSGSLGVVRQVGIWRRTYRTVPARLDQGPGGLERGDLGGAEPELLEYFGVVLALASRQLPLVGRHLVREVQRTARDRKLAGYGFGAGQVWITLAGTGMTLMTCPGIWLRVAVAPLTISDVNA